MRIRYTACLCVCALLAACSAKAPQEPAVARAAVSLSTARVPLGSPMELKYKFTVSPQGGKIDGDYRVFAHFVEAGSREMMWGDDHYPPIPTSQWKPGQVIEYSRTMFAPVYPYVGQARLEIGLYSAKGRRLTIDGGVDRGHQSFEVAKLELLPQTENIFLIYKEGWHPTEVAPDSASSEWQWTKKDAVLAFRNPKRDVLFYLQLDRPATAAGAPTVTVTSGDQVVDTFVADGEIMRKVPLTAAQLGSGDMVELKISVDKTFVPSLLPASNSHDSRELGVRVFHAFVAPR
ncbi:MAG: hypothetical protein ACM3NQ_07160 [Bacteroidales bacterium]